MDSKTVLIWLTIGLALLTWLIAFNSYGELPERVPVHFNGQGQPDGWADKSPWIFFMIPFIQTILAVLIIWFRKFHHLYSFPRREEVKKLPEELQKPIWGFIEKMMLVIGFFLSLTFLVVEFIVIKGAENAKLDIFYSYFIIIISLGWLPLIIYMLIKIGNLVKAANRNLKSSLESGRT